MGWKSDLWSWLGVHVGEWPLRLYYHRKKRSLWVNSRVVARELRVEVDDHLLTLVAKIDRDAFAGQQHLPRYQNTFLRALERVESAAGRTVSPVTAAHGVLLPLGSPKRTTVSINVYTSVYFDIDELLAKLSSSAGEHLVQLRGARGVTHEELGAALGLREPIGGGDDDDDTDEPGVAWEDHRNMIFFGPPGTGKSFGLAQIVTDHLKVPSEHVYRVTFHPETTYFDFVGSYKPVVGWLDTHQSFTDAAGVNTRREPRVYYDYEAGPFCLALARALTRPEERVVLVIEEINRGNCAAIFGDVFQLLDRSLKGPDIGESEYAIVIGSEWRSWLSAHAPIGPCWDGRTLRMPGNLYLYATMNTSDQSLFPMDTAFRRRWGLRYHGARAPVGLETKVRLHAKDKAGVQWSRLAQVLNERIVAYTRSDDKQMGPWFIRQSGDELVPDVDFRSKVLFYLWADVFRDSPGEVFASGILTYDGLLDRWESGGDVFAASVLEQLRGSE